MNLKLLLKRIIRPVRYSANVISWKREFNALKKRKVDEQKRTFGVPDGKTLVIVPHADDEIFGAYGFIRGNPETELFFMGFTGSNSDVSNKLIRDREFISSANAMKRRFYFADHIALSDILNTNKYKNILCPSIIDWHEEHRLCNKLLLEGLKQATSCNSSIYWYDVTVPIMALHDTIYIPMSKEVQKDKYNLFKQIYKSQSFMPAERFALQERVNALGTNHYSCEIICMITLNDLKKYVSRLYGEQSDQVMILRLNDLKKYISRIRKIREESKRLYSKLENME